METLRFSLGIRFDFLTKQANEELVHGVFHELCSAIPLEVAEDLMIYGGKYDRYEYDGGTVYMVIFTKGCLKNMRKLFRIIDNDAVLHGMLCLRDPYLQNNVLRDLEGFEYFGIVGSDGRVSGGCQNDLLFTNERQDRIKLDKTKSILVIPNAYKGTMSSFEASKCICSALRTQMPCACIETLPVADGGDGTLRAVESMICGIRRTTDVTAPYGKIVRSAYYSIDGTSAIIESALASGLALCKDEELDPLKATSRGTGELIVRALHEGIKKVYICLGGSATNDCGLGALCALGYKFIDKEGAEIDSADRLGDIISIDDSCADPFNKKASFTVVCDVENPLIGQNGATYTFGRQKGADQNALDLLETGITCFAALLERYAGKSVSELTGAGAAGGMGAAFMALLNAEYKGGADMILDIAEFEKRLKHTSVVITGEGCIDSTSVEGKAVGVIEERASACGVPTMLIGGKRGEGAELAEARSVRAVYCNNTENREKALYNAALLLADDIKTRYGF